MRLVSIFPTSHFSFFRDRYALSAQTSLEVFPVVTSCFSIRPSAAEADVTALSRMNPNPLSMEICDLYPKTGTAIIGSGVPSGRYRTLPPTFSVQRAFVSF
jgi:hypothetical protein